MAISKRLRFEILRRDGHRCRYCGAGADNGVELVVDHVLPEALGGKTESDNLVTACEPCNSGKASTVPDADQVAAVSQDAARWAAAIQAAAVEMLGERHATAEANEWFRTRWNRWVRSDGSNEPLPADWADTIERFRSLGLPDQLLDDAICTTMPRWGVEDRFRYFCGVAWGMVRDLQDRAQEVLTGPKPAPRPNRSQTLAAILDRCDPALDPWEYDRIILEFQEAMTYGPGGV